MSSVETAYSMACEVIDCKGRMEAWSILRTESGCSSKTPRNGAGRGYVLRHLSLRIGLIALTVSSGVTGAWALLAPRSFYDDFPGGRRSWVSALPPYNEHLVRDVGGLYLALTLVLLAAAVIMERRLVIVALVAALLNAVPHFIFHVTHVDELSTGDQIAQTASLVFVMVVPMVLLPVAVAREPEE